MATDYSGVFLASAVFVDGGSRYAKGDEVKATDNHKRELHQNGLVEPKRTKKVEPERTQDVTTEKPKGSRPRKSISTKTEE